MIILAHGGAGAKKPVKKALKRLEAALRAGYLLLKRGEVALQAVIETIRMLEDSGLFNAGRGGNLQLDGKRRLDASLMEGGSLRTGSVIGLEGYKNPILAARLVMELPHRVLTNEGASKVASANRLASLPGPNKMEIKRLKKLISGDKGFKELYEMYFSTVGAVALDSYGLLASGSSTGGVALMLPGRVGDTPIIGAGVYAENDYGAVSCTGRGEDILRLALSKEVAMQMKGLSPQRAAESSLKRILRIGGQAGLLALNRKGEFAITHTTDYMASGYAAGGRIVVKEGFKRVIER